MYGFIVVLVIAISILTGVLAWNSKQLKKKQKETELKNSYIQAAILPSNMGKDVDLVIENISQSNISTNFHL